MAAPTSQAAPTTANPNPPNPDGFAYSDKGTKWDTTVPSAEPPDFDLLSQPDYPDISLLETAMNAACIDVEEATNTIITGWGLTSQRETAFAHNLSDNDAIAGIANSSIRNVTGLSSSFWIVQAIGTYEGESNEDKDPNTESVTRGFQAGTGYFLVYNEAIRDFSKNTPNARNENNIKRGVAFHECLHCFGVKHAQGGIMDSKNWASTISTTVWDKLLKTHVITIQSADAPDKKP